MSEQRAELSKRAMAFLKHLYNEYEQDRGYGPRMGWSEDTVVFSIGYVDRVYYSYRDVADLTDELIDAGYLGTFASPNREIGFATFTPEGFALCRES